MPLTGDVRRLCDHLAHDHDKRRDAVHAIRENAMRMMSGVQEAHRKRSREMSQRIHDLNAARDRMTAEQRHKLTEFHDDLLHNVSEFVGDLEEAHRDRAFQICEHIHDLGTARMKMGAEQVHMLIEFHNDLQDSVSEFVGELQEASKDRSEDMSQHLDDLGAARAKMSAEQEQMLAEFHSDIHDSVDDFVSGLQKAHEDRARDVSQELHDLGAARKKMSAEQQRKLTKDRARLEATVNQTRKELRADMKGAHRAWNTFAAKAPHRETRTGTSARPTPARPSAHAAGEKGSTAAANDDLTVISGIGPSRQERLNELGIRSFAQLANATEAKLRDALGQSARLANVGKWIEDAKKHV
jgi:predicted flap endonuclease-1-like 5' DNA nuclease